MAVVTINVEEILTLTNLKKEQIVDGLNYIGMPVEEDNGEFFIEVTPNRPDLFSIEGVARALKSFYNKQTPLYSARNSPYILEVDKSVGAMRPYIVSAIVKNIEMNEAVLRSMIQLQEKLHETIGRKRKKVAIGLHDADNVIFPLIYKFVKNEKFVPLDFSYEMSVVEILEKHPKGVAYKHLVGPEYPMLYDKKGVISFPPIINSERTRVTENSRNIVIDITGTHLQTLIGTLNILVCALADRGGEIYKVNISGERYPKLTQKKMELELDKINAVLGQKLSKKEVFNYLMRLGWSNDGVNSVFVPQYRMDVSNYVDIVEDIAIAYDYNKLVPTTPNFFTPGELVHTNEELRQIMLNVGFVEVVNYILVNEALEAKTSRTGQMKIINPKTKEFTLMRTGLIGSLLNNIVMNKNQELPIKIFEIGRVYDGVEKTKFAFAIAAESVDFSDLRGVLQTIMKNMGFDFELKRFYNNIFINGRCAEVWCNNKKVGFIGEINPITLDSFNINYPVGVGEFEF